MHVLVVANGAPDDLPAGERVPAADLVIAANGGAANARRLGLRPSVIIGDMDSMTPADKAELEAAALHFITYPINKDATDLELALRFAVEQGAKTITVVGALGGRPDQMLANVFLVTLPFLAGVEVSLLGNGWQAFAVRDTALIEGAAGDTLSLIPLTPEVTGVTTTGLAWSLDKATLVFGSSLGISNRMTEDVVRISVGEGIMLVVHGEWVVAD